MPRTTATVTIEDKSGQPGKVELTLNDTLAGFTNLNTIASELDALVDEIKGVISGAVRYNTITIRFDEDVTATAGGSRELKWLITYRDDTPFLDAVNTISNPGFGRLYSVTLPTVDEALIPAGSETVNLTAAPWNNFIADFEQVVRAPSNRSAANPVIKVVSIRKVGRNI